MTVEGEAALRIELEKLKREDRPTVIQAIAEAREHGDLKENAEYHAAREQQGFIEGRIQDIESKLSLCQIINISQIPQGDRVIFGSTVTIIKTETEEKINGNTLWPKKQIMGQAFSFGFNLIQIQFLALNH